MPLGQSFKSSPGEEHPSAPCHRRVIGPLWARLAGVRSVTRGANSHHGSWVKPGETSGKQTCPRWAGVLRAETSLSNCYGCDGQGDTSSSSWEEQALQADPCSFHLYFGPQILYVMGSGGTKLTKKSKRNPHPLFTTTYSSTIDQTYML